MGADLTPPAGPSTDSTFNRENNEEKTTLMALQSTHQAHSELYKFLLIALKLQAEQRNKGNVKIESEWNICIDAYLCTNWYIMDTAVEEKDQN